MLRNGNVIGETFSGRCPICGNKGMDCESRVYSESGDSIWDYHRYTCGKCGSVILVEEKTDMGDCFNAKGESVDWYGMSECPRCGSEGNEGSNEWDIQNGAEVNYRDWRCPRCGLSYQSKEVWDVKEETVYAVKEKDGRYYAESKYLAEQGPYTYDYL